MTARGDNLLLRLVAASAVIYGHSYAISGITRFLPGFNRLGDYSYGVYLWRFPIQQVIAQLLPVPTPARITLIALPCAIAIGALSWHLLEKPLLRLKRPMRAVTID